MDRRKLCVINYYSPNPKIRYKNMKMYLKETNKIISFFSILNASSETNKCKKIVYNYKFLS